MNASVSAHDLRSYDCAWPGCPREARREGGYCDMGHVGTPLAGERGRIAPGALAHLADDQPEPPTVKEEPAVTRCKTAGCTNERLAAKGGLYAGLCAPCKRAKMQARLDARTPPKGQSEATQTPAAAREPAPAAAPEPAADGTLAELGRRVDERIARIHTLTQQITTERELLADDVNTFQARVRQAQEPEPTTP